MSRLFKTVRVPPASLVAMSHLSRAAAAMAEIVRGIRADHLSAPTPCAEYDVRALVNHLLFWGPSLEGAGRKEAVPPPAAADTDVDLTTGDWAGDLLTQLDRTTAAWAASSAWEGDTVMGSPMELPAAVIGDMIVGELVVHGWDLARATGQTLELDDELLTYVHAAVASGAEQGRDMGIYGAEVAVPATAPMLARIVGLTGRDPEWSAAGAGVAGGTRS
ncbi:MAG: TIGR03086 family protein [Pseudonocardiaceae bacterium]|nr:TIGR03086 family protein [Pseudonocardiaceae bacterium]